MRARLITSADPRNSMVTERMCKANTQGRAEKTASGSEVFVRETHRAAALSAHTAEPAGPPAGAAHTGVVVFSTVHVYCHSHTSTVRLLGSGRENVFLLIKEHSYPLHAVC